MGYLNSTAIYEIPIDDLAVGQINSLDISQQVEAKRADRFTINLHTNRKLKLKLDLKYNKDQIISNETTINEDMNYFGRLKPVTIEVELERMVVPKVKWTKGNYSINYSINYR